MKPTSIRGLMRGLICAGLVFGLAACSSKKGSVREPTPLQDISEPQLQPRTSWRVSAGDGSDGRVSGLRLHLEEDALYTADVDGQVFAYARDTGELLWRSATGARVISGPSVNGNAVYVGTLDAEVIALSRADGSELWRQTVSSEVHGAPAADGEVVVVRSVDGRVFGLSTGQGLPIWNFDRAVPSLVLRGNSMPLVGAGRVIIGMDNGRVASLSLNDGQPLWEQAVAVPSGRTELERITDIDGDLLDAQSCVVASSFGGELACLNFESGQVQWRRPIRNYADMAVSSDKLFVTDEAGTGFVHTAPGHGQADYEVWRAHGHHEVPRTVGADGQKHTPVMIHRACYGSVERFFGILIEHYAGAFPTWLAPVQAKVMTITDDQIPFGKKVEETLLNAGLRVQPDFRNEKIGKKIREAQMEKVPYMLVIGAREAETGQVALRVRGVTLKAFA